MRRETRYLSWKEYLKEFYGEPLYRIPVDLGYGCPNRDISGKGGCAFCAGDGGRARQILSAVDLADQVAKAAAFARRRYGARRFMLYIQAYTGTFTDPLHFKEQVNQLLALSRFDALSIGTRPDCLPDDVLNCLAEINRKLDVWLELGVQSTHDATLERINRGHNWLCSEKAVRRIDAAGLKPAVHLILGLPGEGCREWKLSAERIAGLPVQAVKLHNLHIIRGTKLAEEHARLPLSVLDEHSYAQAVIEVLRRIPSNIPLMRLTTDTPGEKLLAPRWSMSKGEFSEYLTERMCFQGVRQGDLCVSHADDTTHPESKTPLFESRPTDDGSITFWSGKFKEHFHSKVGAVTEAFSKFVEPAALNKLLKKGNLTLLDICYGLGCNTLAACETAEKEQSGRLYVTAIEIDINVIRSAAVRVVAPGKSRIDWCRVNRNLVECGQWTGKYSSIRLLHGDARDKIEAARNSGNFDIVFLDAFSTQRNAELWTVDFFRRIKSLMSEKAVLLTYCAALPVRSGLIQAGFYVGETAPVGRRRGGTIAAVRAEDITAPLSEEEVNLISNTKRGIPYRDPDQVWTNRRILKEREKKRRNVIDQALT
ncbi:MAG: TIGR01212 family radical SAM protein [Kiritimatiellia bacterium]